MAVRETDAGTSDRRLEACMKKTGSGMPTSSGLNSVTTTTLVEGTICIKDVKLGKEVRYYSFVNLYGCSIGDETKIGTFVEIQKGVVIGARCKISSHSFVCEGVRIEDDVFVGHGVMFINDKYPHSSFNGKLITDQWTMIETIVESGASIGTNATILGGVRIGSGALVGAGSVVTHDVPPGAVFAGNPAVRLKASQS